MTLAPSLGLYVRRDMYGTLGILREEWVFHNAEELTVAPSLFRLLSAYCNVLQFTCARLSGFTYLVLTKLTLSKQTSDLKRFLQRNCGFKIILIMQAQENNKKMAELTLLLLLVWVLCLSKNNDNLIRSDKNLAQKNWNYQYQNKLNLETDL